MVYVVGANRYWRKSWQQFFSELELSFVKTPKEVPANSTALIWGMKTPKEAFDSTVSIKRVEDGFIRSVGLGAALVRPSSWVVDVKGMYFDATQPSDLEKLLQTKQWTSAELERAKELKDTLRQLGVSKYNTGQEKPLVLNTNKPTILVPGQVETDASIQLGSPEVKSNLELLKKVRRNNPDKYVIYKPHPDVVAGIRAKGQGEDTAKEYCDQYVIDISIHTLLEQVDEVHTMTSLCGFEALLRDKKVTCYGQPFYSGWGLTTDKISNQRRTRKLVASELIHGALIDYPLYIHPETGSKSTVEDVIQCISQQRKQKQHSSLRQKLLTSARKLQTAITGRK